ncbi:hypothetical protein IFM89_032394 [Coptis chinensis]|uniref:RING-type E3 ubiquitin transferase n=1 Tax=Coptis chinensis TaxID=261450 RepID=A0A835HZA6_9MAGN|nr:hypothetical protein IFM89_032394 [Coptis chinensis]
MAEQHFLKHNDSGSWVEDSALMLAMSKEVPWYLDDGTGRVHVVGARGANGLVLAIGREIFEESGRSLVRGTLDYLQGLKMLGVKGIERVLPIGTSLTVVGEGVKDDIGTIRIQRPHKGPFYVSPKSIDQLIANLGIWSRIYKYASMGWGLLNMLFDTSWKEHADLICSEAGSTMLLCYPSEKHVMRSCSFRVLAAAAQRLEQDHDGSDEKADNGPESAKKERLMADLCVICLEHKYNTVFVPVVKVSVVRATKFRSVWTYVLLYDMLITLDQLFTLSASFQPYGCLVTLAPIALIPSMEKKESTNSNQKGVCEKLFDALSVTPTFRPLRRISHPSKDPVVATPALSPVSLPPPPGEHYAKSFGVQDKIPGPGKPEQVKGLQDVDIVGKRKVAEVVPATDQTLLLPSHPSTAKVRVKPIKPSVSIHDSPKATGSRKIDLAQDLVFDHVVERIKNKVDRNTSKKVDVEPGKEAGGKVVLLGDGKLEQKIASKVEPPEVTPTTEEDGKKGALANINDKATEYIARAKRMIRTTTTVGGGGGRTQNFDVPKLVTDDGTGRVNVREAQGASGFSLTTASYVFEEAHKCLAVEDNTGKIQIQRPQVGPFYASGKSIDKLIEDREANARTMKQPTY